MHPTHLHKPPRPNNDVPDGFEPGVPPVEPDEGPVPILDPDEPGHERVIDPAASQDRAAQRAIHQTEVTGCP